MAALPSVRDGRLTSSCPLAARVLLARFGVGDLVEAVDLHDDVVRSRRQGRHGGRQAAAVRGLAARPPRMRHVPSRMELAVIVGVGER